MTIIYNVTGQRRKALTVAVSEILGQPSRYRGMPTAAYEVGGYTIDRAGTLRGPDNRRLIFNLSNLYGFRAIAEEYDTPKSGGTPDRLVIDMPLHDFTPEKLDNLSKLVEAKAVLLKKVFGAEDLPVAAIDGKLRFPWFTLTGADGEMDAYLRFITALCEMAKKQKHVTAKAREVENDKFTMRLFLIRLGFVGPEYKAARKILLRNLTGNTAWKSGQRPERGVDEP